MNNEKLEVDGENKNIQIKPIKMQYITFDKNYIKDIITSDSESR